MHCPKCHSSQIVKYGRTHYGKLTLQCDEMWSFVGKKENKQWIWFAMNEHTREIVGVFVGDRSRKSSGVRLKSEQLTAIDGSCDASIRA